MDIEYLLFLQNLRISNGGVLAEFLSKMTYLGELNVVLLIMAIIYWCISKEFGVYLMMGWSGNRILNGFLKVTACVYRPWIRDARTIPHGDSITTATGYSFPSGHTMNAASLYGGGAIRKELPRIMRIFLAILLVLVGFSRNYLGVHTPQDVIVGMIVGLLVMWLTGKLIAWIDAHPEKDYIVVIVGIAVAVAVAVYAACKPYPEDYDEAGKILVEGAKMANGTFKAVGWCIGFLAGWILEKRTIRFSTDVPMMTRATRLVTGLLGYYAVSLILSPLLKGWIPGATGTIISCFVQMFYISFLFPWCIKHFERSGEKV